MTPRVKICGITRPEDGVAAASAGADAVGLVFWPHSPRSVTTARARAIVAALPPFVTVVGLFVDPAPEEVRATLAAVPVDVLQFHGAETAALCRSFGRPYLKAVAASPGTDLLESLSPFDDAAGVLIDAPIYQGMPGGTGRTFDWALLPTRLPRPLVLSGGLHAGNVARRSTTRGLGRWTSRAASRRRTPPERRSRASRTPRASRRSSRKCAMPLAEHPYDLPDARGHFGRYGGTFVAETLIRALDELTAQYARYQHDPEFVAEFERELKHYVGRPSPVYHAQRWSERLGGAQIWFKREDLNHTGAHKINNCIGQALLARRMGKTRVIAETGAGQHGVATATVAALFGMECVVYMGAEDVQRQALNVFRMRLLGAKVVPVESGTPHAQGRDQRGDARLGDERREHPLHHRLRRRPAPLPDDGARLPERDRPRSRQQMPEAAGRLPDVVIACVGGGSNAMGIFHPFIGRAGVELVGVEAAGEGSPPAGMRRRSPRAAPASCTATAPTCCRTRTARSSRRTRSRRASTTRASARSTPTSRTARRALRLRSRTTRRSTPSTTAAASRASSRRSNRRTRWRTR